jgi:hypothetical protein
VIKQKRKNAIAKKDAAKMNAILTGINITDKNEKVIPKKQVSIGHIPRNFFILFY